MRISYLSRVLLLLVGLVLLVELASYVATRLVVHETVSDNARRELLRGGEVFAELLQGRAEQLSLSAEVLTDDFGFKQAVAVADEGTLVSALANHAARINADIALVADLQGELMATTQPLTVDTQRYLTSHLGTQADRQAYRALMINERPYQLVVSEISAPVAIGSAGLGFEIDNELTENLKRLTGLDIAFVSLEPEEGGLRYLSGTLAPEHQQPLLHRLLAKGFPAALSSTPFVETTKTHMALIVPVATEPTPLAAVLHVPLAQVMAPFERLNGQLVWVALGFSLLAVLFAVFLARSVTQPVRALAEVARRVASGFYDTPVPIRSRDEMGDLASGFINMQKALSERESKILHQARHDHLTGLMNRSELFVELEGAVKQVRASEVVGVLVLDIDNFTRINDTLSPEMGDRVLQSVGERLCRAARDVDRVARLGSDEFVMLLWLDEKEDWQARAAQVVSALESDIELDDMNLSIGVHIGIALSPADGEQPERLLRRATLALNRGRIDGRAITRYQNGWDEQHLRRLALFGEFKRALAEDQLDMNYQPKLWLDGSGTLGAEALVRWSHPELGMINPEEFVAVAESTGQIGLLTRWVLRRSIAQASSWSRRVHLSVNLSVLDLLDDRLPDYVAQVLEEYRWPADHLCLEITESAIMQEADRSVRNLERLKALGASLSIDDFGTGYSSLSQLKKLPVSELKIDKSFILNLDNYVDDQQIVRSIIDLGHMLGLSITAEGVENSAIEEYLVNWRCDRVQGYFYSKPLTHSAFIDWLASSTYVDGRA